MKPPFLNQNKIMEKVQFNVRVRPEIKKAAIKVAKKSMEFTNEEVVEIALINLFGTQDELLLAKRNKALRIINELGLNLAFNDPQLLMAGIAA